MHQRFTSPFDRPTWDSDSTVTTSFTIYRYPIVDGVMQSDPDASMTVDGEQRSATFVPDDSGFAQPDAETGDGTANTAGYGMNASDGSTTTPTSQPVQNASEPTSPWTNIMSETSLVDDMK